MSSTAERGGDTGGQAQCSGYLVPADIVHAWHRNQRLLDLDRPADKQLGDRLAQLERAIKRDAIPAPDKQVTVAQELGKFLTSKKARAADATAAATRPLVASSSGRSTRVDEVRERALTGVPASYKRKGENIVKSWAEKGMTWDEEGNIYLKGKRVEGATLGPLLRHAASRQRRRPPAGYGHVTRYMREKLLDPAVYGNPLWRSSYWDPDESESGSSTVYYYSPGDETDGHSPYEWQGPGEEERGNLVHVPPGWSDVEGSDDDTVVTA